MSDIEPFFNSAAECAEYEAFCAEQERGPERFELADPALVCRWRMHRRQVPLLNRHIRALSHRVVNGGPLTGNMLSWAKQHVEWSLSEGSYNDSDGVLMLVIDVNGDALMSVGPYEPLSDLSLRSLALRAAQSRTEASAHGVAPEVLAAVATDGRVLLGAAPDEPLCAAASLVEQLAQTKGREVVRAFDADGRCTGRGPVAGGAPSSEPKAPLGVLSAMAGEGAVWMLISDEHGVVLAQTPEGTCPSGAIDARACARELSSGVAKLFSR